ncbi:histidine phosphatase family protein [Nocardia alni]|uniref:histidine phosphatase family protein n=1 Tax=Nocardia alni TaxID=2815723 RepID=UPI001C233846|nr:histidine phosphatase family protein [Nocardia alni]
MYTWKFAKPIVAILAAISLSSCSAGADGSGSHSTRSTNSQQHSITITFMRHGESGGNASGLIDTSTPGPDLTAKGRTEAQAAADAHRSANFDGIFASTMVRTQETAQYLADDIHKPIHVLPGLREIEAGQYEHQPESTAERNYLQAPMEWLQGQRDARIPGSIDGNEFENRFDGAVQQIYDSGDSNPIAFAHGGSIMIWTLMNVRNPDDTLLKTHPLGNTATVQIVGNPRSGWKLLNWDGVAVAH